jgi:hypothetical protein
LKDSIESGKRCFCISIGFLKNALPKGIKSWQVWAKAYQSTTSSNPLFELAVTNKITTESLDMHPEDVIPFFPIQDALWLDFQVFGNLAESNDKSFGVNAMT